MGKTYHLNVVDRDGVSYANVDGDIDVIAYVVRKLDIDSVPGEFAVDFAETEAIEGEDVRTVLKLTSAGELVSLLLKKRITAERKANKPADESGQSESAGDEQVPNDAQELVESVLS